MKTKSLFSDKKSKRNPAYSRNTAWNLTIAGFAMSAPLFLASDASALGFRIPNQDAEAIGRGNAFAATADDPSAIYYNPAGITQLPGLNAQYGVHALSLNSFYESPSGKSAESKFSIQPVPQFYATYTPENSPFSFGAGLYAPYGMAMEWLNGSPFRTSSTYYGALTYVTFNPVVAYKINDQLSVAVGPTINYAQVLLRQGVPIAGLDPFQFRGDDTAFGFTGGILWKPLEKLSFGANYHSATTMKFGGSADFGSTSTHSTAEVPFGQFFSVGASYRPSTNWNVELDVDWTDWSHLKTVTFNNTPVGNVPFPLNWQSSFMVELGGTRYLDNGYLVSAGYFFSQTSTTDQDFTPTVPDTNLHVGSVGFGRRGEHWSWMLAAQIITGPNRVISNNVNHAVDGSYHWVNGSLNFSIGYHF